MESIEILAVVESVSNEKGIEEGIIFGALETANVGKKVVLWMIVILKNSLHT